MAKAGVRPITKETRRALYATRRNIPSDPQKELSLRIPFDTFFQDPSVAASNPACDFDSGFYVPWEPGISDGPTSARFAVVDYDGGTEALTPPARWDESRNAFLDEKGNPVNRGNRSSPQFRQMNVWATLQNALDFFENPVGLGRRIEWGFKGNRLIVVPHAGYGENAFYDRDSKSLQFYYFDRDKEGGARKRVYTCLSADIINHEFGHAVLDGVRPLLHESVFAETAAFHEFAGDMAAILIAFRNTPLRTQIAKVTQGKFDKDNTLSSIAEEFGENVGDQKPFLRTALNKLTYKDVKDDQRQHYMSEVLTGAMFDIIQRITRYHIDERKRTVPQALWDTIQRMQCMMVQPLDLLPPVDVTFEDYALAVLRAELIVNPADPDGYRAKMIEVFRNRGIISRDQAVKLRKSDTVFRRLDVDVFHDPDSIATSRASAYRFLDDNRRTLFIPRAADVVVSDLTTAHKMTVAARRLPKQILLQYVWREDVPLDDPRFGRFAGETTSMLCGGTLALDVDGNCLAWARKPGTMPLIDTRPADQAEAEAGQIRRAAFLDALAARIEAGRIGEVVGGAAGLLAKSITPLTSHVVDGTVRFGLSPHIAVASDIDEEMGERPWQISS